MLRSKRNHKIVLPKSGIILAPQFFCLTSVQTDCLRGAGRMGAFKHSANSNTFVLNVLVLKAPICTCP